MSDHILSTQSAGKENEKTFSARFGAEYGDLKAIRYRDWEVAAADQGVSFEMLIPTQEKRSVWVRGVHTSPVTRMDGGSLELRWENPVDTQGNRVDISVIATADVDGDCLVFSLEIDNRSDRTVEAVRWPVLSGMAPRSESGTVVRRQFDGSGFSDIQLYPRFPDNQGYWGTYLPTESAGSSNNGLFQLIECDGYGLYIGCHDPSYRYLVKWVYELNDGYEDSYTMTGDPGSIVLSVQHFPFAGPGQRVSLSPTVMAGYTGSWCSGADVYRDWRRTWHKKADLPDWMNAPHTWLQIQIYGAEDVVNFRYSDLPEIADECSRYGIKAIQLTGWAHGGQDRGNPLHDTDPVLGTDEELRTAIARCRERGVEVVLFCKWTWIDQSAEHFEGFRKHLALNAYGYPYPAGGYSYYTETQLARINTCPLVPTCTASPVWRSRAVDEFKKVLALNPSGILFDEGQHHGSAYYCFAEDHDHPRPAFLYAYDAELARSFRREVPDSRFLLSGELLNDGEMNEYQLSYTRFSDGHVPVYRYVAPEAELMMAVPGYNDRNRINECLKYRYILSYEPRNFKGRPGEIPLTVAYGQLVEKLRHRYRGFLWDGTFKGPTGARVIVDGHGSDNFSSFESEAGRRGFVYAHTGSESQEMVEIHPDASDPDASWYLVTPEHADPVRWSGSASVAPRSAIVILEMD